MDNVTKTYLEPYRRIHGDKSVLSMSTVGLKATYRYADGSIEEREYDNPTQLFHDKVVTLRISLAPR